VVDKVEQLAPVDKLLPGTELLRIYGRRPDPDAPHDLRMHRKAADMVRCLDNGYPIELLLNNTDQVVTSVLGELAAFLG
jgi:hypothetical protein